MYTKSNVQSPTSKVERMGKTKHDLLSGAVGYCRIIWLNFAGDFLTMPNDPQGVEGRQNPVQKQGASRIIPHNPGWSRVSLISECSVQRPESVRATMGRRRLMRQIGPRKGGLKGRLKPRFGWPKVVERRELFRVFRLCPPLGISFSKWSIGAVEFCDEGKERVRP